MQTCETTGLWKWKEMTPTGSTLCPNCYEVLTWHTGMNSSQSTIFIFDIALPRKILKDNMKVWDRSHSTHRKRADSDWLRNNFALRNQIS